jgi:hypothetical protein
MTLPSLCRCGRIDLDFPDHRPSIFYATFEQGEYVGQAFDCTPSLHWAPYSAQHCSQIGTSTFFRHRICLLLSRHVSSKSWEELPLPAVFPECSQGASGSRPTGLNTTTTTSALPVRIMNQKPLASDTSTAPDTTATGRTLVLCFDGTSEQYDGYASLLHSVLLHYS